MTVTSPRFWTTEEDALVLSDVSLEIAAGQLGRSVNAVRLRRWKLNADRVQHDWPERTGAPRNNIEDVWKYVERKAPDKCWLYTGAKRRRGYGAFTVNGKTFPAHRVAFMAATGTHPGDLMVCHRCDNPSCCNPAHLFLGTATDNVHDMLAKGRARPTRGSRHYAAKLTEAQVRELRRRRQEGAKFAALAIEFGISESRASVIAGRPDIAWSHV